MPSTKRAQRTDAQQPNPWKVTFLTALLTSIITLGGSFGLTKWNDTLEKARRVKQERREVYSNLRGAQVQVESLIGNKADRKIRILTAEAVVRMNGEEHPQRERILNEIKRLVEAEEDITVQIGQALRELHKYAAMTEVLFPRSRELREHIDKLYAFTGIGFPGLTQAQWEQLTSAESIDSWHDRAYKKSREIILQEFRKPTHALLNYLASQIPVD